jgi:hypothetical protein
MEQEEMQTTLRQLGITPSNYRVLELLPLVYAGWTSGKISQERELRLLAFAQNHFAIGEDGEQILKGWLRHCPDIAYFREGLHDVLLLARVRDECAIEMDELPGLLAYAEAIARTTAEAMNEPFSLIEGEALALAEIARELGVVDGESWGVLVRALRAMN